MYRQGVAWVRNCVNHPNCGTTNCNGCEVIAACPAPGACTEEFCASRAAEMDLPFQSVHKSNGAPRGCVKYREGVAWVRNCVNHPNCGTTNCNGCEVIAACPAPEACTEEFCASRAAEMDLSFQSVHKSNGAPR